MEPSAVADDDENFIRMSDRTKRAYEQYSDDPTATTASTDQEDDGEDEEDGEDDGEEDDEDEEDETHGRAPPLEVNMARIAEFINQQLGPGQRVDVNAFRIDPRPETAEEESADLMHRIRHALRCHEALEIAVEAMADKSLQLSHIALLFRFFAWEYRTLPEFWTWDHDQMMEDLVVYAKERLATEKPDAMTYSSLLWSLPRIVKYVSATEDVLPSMYDGLKKVAIDMDMQNITHGLTAIAKLQREQPAVKELADPLLNAFLEKAETQTMELEPKHIGILLWATGELEIRRKKAFEVVAAVLNGLKPQTLEQFEMKDLANFVWGLAELGAENARLMEVIGQLVAKRAELSNDKEAAVDLPQIVCGFVRLAIRHVPLLDAVEARISRSKRGKKSKVLKRMNDWAVAALLWAWPREGHYQKFRAVLEQEATARKISNEKVEKSWQGPQGWGTGFKKNFGKPVPIPDEPSDIVEGEPLPAPEAQEPREAPDGPQKRRIRSPQLRPREAGPPRRMAPGEEEDALDD